MSDGRVELGLGAGWYAEEHAAHGIPFPERRFDRLDEQLQCTSPVRVWVSTRTDMSRRGASCSRSPIGRTAVAALGLRHHIRVPTTSHLMSDDPWELSPVVVDNIAASLRAEFGSRAISWPDVIRFVVRAVDQHISTAALDEAASIAHYLCQDDVAVWLETLTRQPVLVEAEVIERLENHAQFIALGPFVRRGASVRNGVDDGPGPWHESACRFVAQAWDVTAWEGVETLPDDGRLCKECRAGQPAIPAQLPLADRERARDEIRDQIAALGAFVRRRAHGEFPPGKWHAGGCRTTRTANDVRFWEGAHELPAGEDVCKTCLRS